MTESNFPLSHPQRRIWYSEVENPQAGLNNLSWTHSCPEGTTEDDLEKAWNHLLQISDGLRIGLLSKPCSEDDFPASQVVHPWQPKRLSMQTFSTWIEADQWMRAETSKPYHLYGGPFYQLTGFRVLGEGPLQVFVKTHHIVSDGWSCQVLRTQLRRALTGEQLPELPSYRQFVRAERDYLNSEDCAADRAFWTATTQESLEPVEFGSVRSKEGPYILEKAMPKELFALVKEFAKLESVSWYKQVMTALTVSLSRHSRLERLGLGLANHNRFLAGQEQNCGMYVSTLPFVCPWTPEKTFRELCRQTSQDINTFLKAHSRYPLDLLVAEQRKNAGIDLGHLTKISLVGHGNSSEPFRWISMGSLAKSLTIHVNYQGEAERGTLEIAYVADGSAFSRSQLEALHRSLCAVLSAGLAAPETPVGRLPLVDESESQTLLALQGPFVPYRDSESIPDLFRQQVERVPDKVALICGSESLTYQQLDRRSDAIAKALLDTGEVDGRFVGVCLNRGPDLVAAVLGVLKAGAAYVPLDPEYPQERLRSMVEDAEIAVVVGLPQYSDLFAGLKVLEPDRLASTAALPKVEIPAHTLAYAIFTSGTTGKPKGVPIEHHQVIHLVQSLSKPFRITSESRVLFFASLNFDASVAEIFPTLLQGATLVIATEEHRSDGVALERLLEEARVTCATIPPALLAVMPKSPLPELQDLVVAGESTDPGVIAYWSQGRRMINAYGPTENTVATSAGAFQEDSPSGDIGPPIENVHCYVLDPHLSLVSLGLPGELYVAGVGVSRGYLHRPDLTQERFLPNPWAQDALRNPRMYKTGDLVRWMDNGRLEFIGRVDFQVKIRGHRIECQEVSTTLAKLPGVNSCLVQAVPQGSTHRLVAYLLPESGVELSPTQVKREAGKVLPDYMVPSAFVLVSEFPRTPNGKIDRRALPQPKLAELTQVKYSAPKTPEQLALSEIWSEVLGLERVGILDDFFDLGGDSLSCMRMVARAQDAGLHLEVGTVRENPTIEALSQKLSSSLELRLPPLLQQTSPSPFPMPANALMMHRQLQNVKQAGGEIEETLVLWDVTGPLDPQAMSLALRALIERYDALRLRISETDERVLLEETAAPTEIKAESFSREELAEVLKAWARASGAEDAPACSFRLFQTGPENWLLGLRGTHELFDAWSVGLMVSDLSRFYNAHLKGEDVLLARPSQLRDFTAWYHDLLQGETWRDSENAWNRLSALAEPVFPEPPSPILGAPAYACISAFLPIPAELLRRLESHCKSHKATLFEGCFALFNLALQERSGKQNILTACVTALRDTPELQSVVASLTNRQYVLTELPRDATFPEALEQTRSALAECQAHKWWPAWQIFDPHGTGFPDLFFHYVPKSSPQEDLFQDLCFRARPPSPPVSWPLGLAFQVLDSEEHPAVFILARSGFCDQAFAESLLRDYLEQLERLS